MTGNVKVIGLCGRSGCGKGFVSAEFLNYGIPSVDTDMVYRDIISEKGADGKLSQCLLELSSEFGEDIITDSGDLDRKALAAIVFSARGGNKLGRLNEITHKYILERTEYLIEKFAENGFLAVIVDAPVLFESGFDKICDIKICVTAPDEVSVERICKRDNKTVAEARMRLANQKTEKELISLCDAVIVNDGLADIPFQVKKIVMQYGLGGEDEI